MNCIGLKVKHNYFGQGIVTSQDEKKIFVKFDNINEEQSFEYPSPDFSNSITFIDDASDRKQKLRDFLVEYIIRKYEKTSFSKLELFDICKTSFSNIKMDELTRLLLSEVRIIVSNRVKINYSLTDDCSLIREQFLSNDINDELTKYGIIKDKNGNIKTNILIKAIIKFITNYIEIEQPNEISKKEMADYLNFNFFSKYKIKPIKLSDSILETINDELRFNKLADYELIDSTLIRIGDNTKINGGIKNKSEVKKIVEPVIPKEVEVQKKESDEKQIITVEIQEQDLIKTLSEYLLRERPDSISYFDLMNYAQNYFYKGINKKIPKLTTELIKKIISETNKDETITFEFSSTRTLKKIKDTMKNRTISQKAGNLVGKNVKHKIYGEGQITAHENNKIFVKFLKSDKELHFDYPSPDFADLFVFVDNTSRNNVVERINATEKTVNQQKVKVVSQTVQNNKQELLTNSGIVRELIKSIILAAPKERNVYTINDIREYFLNIYNKNPGNLITRKLLIDVCIELHDEERKFYLVEGDGNSLQIWKVDSAYEWQKYGLGTVYIPIIQINDKKYKVNEFTLYVYESLNNVRCINSTKHKQENVTIKTNNISGYLVSFNAFYCSVCKKYYTTSDVIKENFPLKNYPFIKLNFSDYSGYYRREESELMIYGYSVKADGPSDSERQNLLSRLLTFGFLSKERIVAIIKDHINYNGRRANMENAVKRWKDDLDFVQNFNISKQRTIRTDKMNIIYRGKKI